VQLEDEDARAVLSVTNQGPVIDAVHLPTLFDPFQKGPASAHSGGLGLGLHIVYEVVKAHGGTIDVTSNAEHGTTFTARFPKRSPSA
jgi:signal transduction histidine kinase